MTSSQGSNWPVVQQSHFHRRMGSAQLQVRKTLLISDLFTHQSTLSRGRITAFRSTKGGRGWHHRCGHCRARNFHRAWRGLLVVSPLTAATSAFGCTADNIYSL
jgi:hypothetical protein